MSPTTSTARVGARRAVLITILLGVLTPMLAALGATPASAAAPQFTNVTVVREGYGLKVYFVYGGTFPPSVTAGTKEDVYASQVRSVVAKEVGNDIWMGDLYGLKPNSTYQVRIDNLLSQFQGTYETLFRKVTVQWRKLYATDDGDDWPNGCGDFYLTADFDAEFRGTWELPVCTGQTYDIQAEDQYANMLILRRAFVPDTISAALFALDMDKLDSVLKCGGMRSAGCGDIASKYTSFDVTKAGTKSHQVRMSFTHLGDVKIDVTATVQVTVTFQADKWA